MVFTLVCIGWCVAAQALPTAQAEDSLEQLGRSTQWVRQLYLETNDGRPSRPRITDRGFYLSDGPLIDPVAELRATYRAFFESSASMGDAHPICEYPSRYLFLTSALNRPRDVDVLADCPAFRNWSQWEGDPRVVVVMVDGYYGNPASSFGHLIVRLGSQDTNKRLLDTSINYGARIPEGEGPLTYIAKGLTGGYQASFTREDFYRQDLVYTRTEHRDMWNYELNLNPEQKRQFVAHLWELLGHPTTYYFVKNNCAFAVAETLEFVLDRDIVDQDTGWYPPVALFQTLEDLHRQPDNEIIASREFVPSQKRKLDAIIASLSDDEADRVQSFIDDPDQDLERRLADRSPEEAAVILEALIEYYDYLIEGYPERGTQLYDQRRRLLVARLGYPPGRALTVEPVPPGTPTGQTAKTRRLEIAAGSQGEQGAALLGFTPFQTAPTDLGNPDLSELTLLGTRVSVADRVSLDDLTLIRVSQRSDVRQAIPGQWPISWTLDVGADCLTHCGVSEGVRLRAGIGHSLSLDSSLVSVLVYGHQAGRRFSLDAVLEAGWAERSGWSLVTEVGYRQAIGPVGGSTGLASLVGRYSVSTSNSMVTSIHFEDSQFEGRIGWVWHLR
ncbi:hypothetical protein GCM10007392_20250 [Saccharospirillum salsuginis]|uniref:DUF4105 domain-containing protein n=1 Tax=Saccharospirillum salsuginis TaxID=418750 RepID=A0A918K740_9GAMM|nr:hypothetical protein GCM10007392_20250 [Saccharospirillum salsuginis]